MFKDLIRKCHNHGIKKNLQVQYFYTSLNPACRILVDAPSNGSITLESPNEVEELYETMTANNALWPSEISTHKKHTGLHEVDVFSALSAQMSALEKKVVDHLTTRGSAKAVQTKFLVCGICGGAHNSGKCHMASQEIEEVNYAQNYQRQQNNAFSNTYNLGWRNYPNFSWSNNQNNQ